MGVLVSAIFRSDALFLRYFVWSKEATTDNEDSEDHMDPILDNKTDHLLNIWG